MRKKRDGKKEHGRSRGNENATKAAREQSLMTRSVQV